MTWRQAVATSSTASPPATSSGRRSPTNWRHSSVKMPRAIIVCVALAALGGGDGIAFAQLAPIAYPAAGQSMDQQAQDEAQCRNIATQATGVSPYSTPPE